MGPCWQWKVANRGLGKLDKRNACLVPGPGSLLPYCSLEPPGLEQLCREGAVLQGETAQFVQCTPNQV